MSQFALTEEFQGTCSLSGIASTPQPVELNLIQTLTEIEAVVPPLWPLKDYVAVNPFLGLSEHKFLTARQMLRKCGTVKCCQQANISELRFEITRFPVLTSNRPSNSVLANTPSCTPAWI